MKFYSLSQYRYVDKKVFKPENFTLNKIGKGKARIEQSSIVYKAPYSTNILIKVIV